MPTRRVPHLNIDLQMNVATEFSCCKYYNKDNCECFYVNGSVCSSVPIYECPTKRACAQAKGMDKICLHCSEARSSSCCSDKRHCVSCYSDYGALDIPFSKILPYYWLKCFLYYYVDSFIPMLVLAFCFASIAGCLSWTIGQCVPIPWELSSFVSVCAVSAFHIFLCSSIILVSSVNEFSVPDFDKIKSYMRSLDRPFHDANVILGKIVAVTLVIDVFILLFGY